MNQSLKIWTGTTQNLDNRNYGIDWLTAMAEHFSVPLFAAKFDKKVLSRMETIRLFRQCKLSRTLCKAVVREGVSIWKSRKPKPIHCRKFGHVFVWIQLDVGKGNFSLSHDSISDLMTINVNEKLWTLHENISIIKAAAEAKLMSVFLTTDLQKFVPRLD